VLAARDGSAADAPLGNGFGRNTADNDLNMKLFRDALEARGYIRHILAGIPRMAFPLHRCRQGLRLL
jgi:hypothetical protein